MAKLQPGSHACLLLAVPAFGDTWQGVVLIHSLEYMATVF